MGQFTVLPSVGSPPLAFESPLAVGTAIEADASLRIVGRGIVAGGSPWGLLSVSASAARLVEVWRNGGEIGPGQGHFARTLVARGLISPRVASASDVDDVDVVIPYRGEAATLRAALAPLEGFAVTVVDDASERPDAIADVAAAAGAALVRRPTRGGPAAARNLGAASTSRPFVWFVDADVVVSDPSEAARRLRGHFDDPTVAAVAARVVGAPGDSARDRFEVRHGPLDLGSSSSLVAARGRVPYVPSACLMVRRVALGDGFDESMHHGEDVDLVWRLGEAGWLVRHDAGCVVGHRARSDWRGFLTQRFNYGRSAAALQRRHPDSLDLVRTDGWTLAAWTAALARRPRAAMLAVMLSRRAFMARLPDGDFDAEQVANNVVVRGMAGAGGPLARSLVRAYGPAIAIAAASRRVRAPALALFVAGTWWRWRHDRSARVADLLPALADDWAYAAGVWAGAILEPRPGLVVPKVSWSISSLRVALLGSTRPRSPGNGEGGLGATYSKRMTPRTFLPSSRST
jgi:mycofactocin system glycosyltransferase